MVSLSSIHRGPSKRLVAGYENPVDFDRGRCAGVRALGADDSGFKRVVALSVDLVGGRRAPSYS